MASGDAARPAAEWVSPRVLRTKARALAEAREILVSDGPAALTFTALARRSNITRPTLYRHWPTRQALLADVVLTGPDTPYPTAGDNPRTVITEFLLSLRSGLSEPSNASALLAVAAQAPYDPASAAALTTILTDRRRALNTLLAPAGIWVTAEDYAQLTGPVLIQLLLAHRRATTPFIHRIVDAWLATSARSEGANTSDRRPRPPAA